MLACLHVCARAHKAGLMTSQCSAQACTRMLGGCICVGGTVNKLRVPHEVVEVKYAWTLGE
jgi:hypothetical protein